MIRPLRRLHRWAFVLLAPVVVVGFALALRARAQASQRYAEALGAPAMVAEAMTAADSLAPGSPPHIAREQSGWNLRVPRDWSAADVLVYATELPPPALRAEQGQGDDLRGASLPGDARLLGALPSAAGREQSLRFAPVAESFAILYGLAHDEILSWAAVEEAP